jgi:hypothetical protein
MRRSLERNDFDGVAVFSETMHRGRDALGDRVTRWLAERPGVEPVEAVVLLTSDQRFHCLTIVLFWRSDDRRRSSP